MVLRDFFANTVLEETLVIGYYGGGNFGDELLLEVILNKLKSCNIKKASFIYSNPAAYSKLHHEFPYKMISGSYRGLKQMIKSKSVIVGGGGLWGMDVNKNIFIMSLMLFLSRFLLNKKIYLIGVGYYQSTNRLGHISAWLAAKSASKIIVRDTESLDNFGLMNSNVYIDHDLAFLIEDMDLSEYVEEAKVIKENLIMHDNMIYITLRKFRDKRSKSYNSAIEECIRKSSNQQFVISLMQPAHEFEEGVQTLREWRKKYKNVQVLNTNSNPVALFLFFKLYARKFRFVTLQYHAIIMGIVCNIPIFPIAYDNKVKQLLSHQPITVLSPVDVTANDIKTFLAL